MSASSILRYSIIVATLTAGCATVPPAPTPVEEPAYVDPTPPQLRLSTQGLRHNILLDEKSRNGLIRRVRSTDEIEFIASAADVETGVSLVRLRGEVQVNCLPAEGTKLVQRMEPVVEEVSSEPEATPPKLSHTFTLAVSGERKKCAAGRFRDMTLELVAEAVNGQGQTTKLQPAIIRLFGPDSLKVGTFNVDGSAGHSDTDYLRWGATLAQTADVLVLTGVPDRRRAELIASMAGMTNVAVLREDESRVAVASKAPLQNIKRQVVPAANRFSERESGILSLNVVLENYPHQLIAAEFGKLGANNEYVGPEKSSPARQKAAQAILSLIPESPEPVFVAGTFNAYSGIGPQANPGVKTNEIELLLTRLLDPFIWLKVPASAHCGPRVDYLMSNISYVPSRYQGCFNETAPSRHPYVLVSFEVP